MVGDNDDEDAYLIMPPNMLKKVTLPETVWAKIGEDGGLEEIRWDVIEMYAVEYDSSVNNRSQTHIMCKLLVLVRDTTRRQFEKA